MITPEMQRVIEENTIGLVATVTADGFPRVSPKGTMVVLDPRRIAFSDIRSPGTIANIARNPAVEVTFIDIFRRTACRLRGTASYHARGSSGFGELLPRFGKWGAFSDGMRGFVVVDVAAAQMLKSPAYDFGGSEPELRRQWLGVYQELHARDAD